MRARIAGYGGRVTSSTDRQRALFWVAGIVLGLVIGWLTIGGAAGIVLGIGLGVAFGIAFSQVGGRSGRR